MTKTVDTLFVGGDIYTPAGPIPATLGVDNGNYAAVAPNLEQLLPGWTGRAEDAPFKEGVGAASGR